VESEAARELTTYLTIVREQSYERGTTAQPSPAENVHRDVSEGTATGIRSPLIAR